MDDVGVVVEDLAATIEFFRELGLELEGLAVVVVADHRNAIRSPEGLLVGLAEQIG
jgi:catechol 2,3-dioxygenase-like lactoylglutathione lyase family enzyme